MSLPKPDPIALQYSEQLLACLRTEIKQKGSLSFARFMALALYAPGLGYYTIGTEKLGEHGDFITAPEISPLFANCIARQAKEIFADLPQSCVLELGAGSGQFACDFMQAISVDHYYILEVSADLRARQAERIKAQCPDANVTWLNTLPKNFTGLIFANEVMDAMPVHCIEYTEHGWFERRVTLEQDRLVFCLEKASGELAIAIEQLALNIAPPYQTEINLQLKPWIHSLSDCLTAGSILLIDYGFSRAEYYLPQRTMGTLMCHYRHHAHHDPFFYPGLQDITAHVDFTAVAEAADVAGLVIDGFATQSAFLLSLGITELAQQDAASKRALQTLTFPHQMGELFKVMMLSRQLFLEPTGFRLQNLVHKL